MQRAGLHGVIGSRATGNRHELDGIEIDVAAPVVRILLQGDAFTGFEGVDLEGSGARVDRIELESIISERLDGGGRHEHSDRVVEDDREAAPRLAQHELHGERIDDLHVGHGGEKPSHVGVLRLLPVKIHFDGSRVIGRTVGELDVRPDFESPLRVVSVRGQRFGGLRVVLVRNWVPLDEAVIDRTEFQPAARAIARDEARVQCRDRCPLAEGQRAAGLWCLLGRGRNRRGGRRGRRVATALIAVVSTTDRDHAEDYERAKVQSKAPTHDNFPLSCHRINTAYEWKHSSIQTAGRQARHGLQWCQRVRLLRCSARHETGFERADAMVERPRVKRRVRY